MTEKRQLKYRILRWLFWRVGNDLYEVMKENINNMSTSSFARSGVSLGTDCFIHHPFYLHNPQHIKIGRQFYAGPGVRIEAWDSYKDQKYQPEIIIGDRVSCSQDVHIGAINSIVIGNNVLIGSHVLITDHSHGDSSRLESTVSFVDRPLTTKGPVVIHDNVWIGEGACILGGVTIGSGAVIGANSVVTRDVEPNQIVGGVPARPINSASKNQL